jgi:hypothetical protein
MSKSTKLITILLATLIIFIGMYFTRDYISLNPNPKASFKSQKYTDKDLPNFTFVYDSNWSVETEDLPPKDPSDNIGYIKFITLKKANLRFEIVFQQNNPQQPMVQESVPDCLGLDYSSSKQYNKFIAIKSDIIDENKKITIFEPISKVWKTSSNQTYISSSPFDTSKCYNEPIKLQTIAVNIIDNKSNKSIPSLNLGVISTESLNPLEVDEIATIIDTITGLN